MPQIKGSHVPSLEESTRSTENHDDVLSLLITKPNIIQISEDGNLSLLQQEVSRIIFINNQQTTKNNFMY